MSSCELTACLPGAGSTKFLITVWSFLIEKNVYESLEWYEQKPVTSLNIQQLKWVFTVLYTDHQRRSFITRLPRSSYAEWYWRSCASDAELPCVEQPPHPSPLHLSTWNLVPYRTHPPRWRSIKYFWSTAEPLKCSAVRSLWRRVIQKNVSETPSSGLP